VYVADTAKIGSPFANLGDAAQSVRNALAALATLPETALVRASSLYRTAPVDSSGSDYVNAVAEVTTRLTAAALLDQLLAIESAAGRERPYPNAPRSLDLDLLLHGERVVVSESLVLPHPRLHQRAFVVLPLLELAPELRWRGGERLDALLPGLAGQRLAKLDR
jgi:2-amino-4-hydroxy-6-hydroxymethyldihydropteridine diphosphokinase